jgi:GNAT superfamily N-acetyltransferase
MEGVMNVPLRAKKIAPARSSKSILTDIVVEHGPVDVFGSFFLHCELETRRRGVALEFCGPEDLVTANQNNRASWKSLVPMFHPKYGIISAENSFSIAGRNAHGEIVTVNSIMKYEWAATDFVDEASSLRLFYADPERMRQPGEECIVTSTRARCIRGRVAISGSAWVRQDYRGLGLSALLPRFIKAYAATRWPLDCIFGLMIEGVQQRGFATQFGFDNLDWEARWVNSIMGTNRLAILWTDVDFLATDLRAVLDRAAEVDRGILKRNAQ